MRDGLVFLQRVSGEQFPFLFGGTFIEGGATRSVEPLTWYISLPFLFGGTFIEGDPNSPAVAKYRPISLPFRRDFH